MTKQVELELKLKKKGSNIKTEFEELKIIRKERKQLDEGIARLN